MEAGFQNVFDSVFQNVLGVGASVLDGYRASTELPTFVWDAENNFFFTQIAGGTRSDLVTMTTPTVTRDIDGFLKWSAHNLVKTSENTGAVVGVIGSGGSLPNNWAAQNVDTIEVLSISPNNGNTSIRIKLNNNNTSGGNEFPGFQINLDGDSVGDYTVELDVFLESLTGTTATTVAKQVTGGSNVSFGTLSVTGDFITDITEAARPVAGSSGLQFFIVTADTEVSEWIINISVPRYHRSDLGGMQNNPDGTDSYVPTTSAGIHKRAINYDTSNNREGAIIEPARTNLVTFSLPDAAPPTDWTDFGGMSTSALATLTNALPGIRFQETTARPRIDQSVTLVASTTYTLSVQVESGGSISVGTQKLLAVVNLSDATGTLTADLGDEDANGRISITFTTGTDTAGNIQYGPGIDGNVTCDVTMGGIQLELGAFATSRIPTLSSTVTRDAVVVPVPKANAGTDAQLTEGTWIMKVKGVADLAGGILLTGATDGQDILRIGSSSAQVINDNGTTDLALSSISPVISDGNSHKMAVAFLDSTGRSLTVDGATVVTDANDYLNTNPPATFNPLQRDDQTLMPGGVMQLLVFIPQRETDAVIKDITDAATAYPS